MSVELQDLLQDRPIVERLFRYLQAHPGRAFTYGDPDLKRAFPGVKERSLDWALWRLHKEGRISRLKKGRTPFFYVGQGEGPPRKGSLRGLLRGVHFTEEEIEEVKRAWGRGG